jgi:hypothetical protein
MVDWFYCGILSRFCPWVLMDNDSIWAVVYDQGVEIWCSDPDKITDDDEQFDDIEKLAVDWLDKNYPNWQDYTAYWD